MSTKALNRIIGVFIVGILLSSLLNLEILNVIIAILLIGFVAYYYRETWKQLSIWQIGSVIFLFGATIALLASVLYFVVRPFVDMISIGWLSNLLAIVIIIAVLVPTVHLLMKSMAKITNGKFPLLHLETERSKVAYPNQVNELVMQLVEEDHIVEAVKEARKLYGYSLLEAKQYIDGIKNDKST